MTLVTTNSTGSSTPASLTLDGILRLQESLKTVPQIPEFRETTLAVQRSQCRVYARRRAKSLSHWQRINKKWLKRFGQTEIPSAFEMDVGIAWGLPSKKILFIHPDLMRQVRHSFKNVMDRQWDDVMSGFDLGKSEKP